MTGVGVRRVAGDTVRLLQGRRRRQVNLVRGGSVNYAAVEREIADAVLRHLPSRAVGHTTVERDPAGLNFTLFIRQDADVLMSHGLADKRYLWMRDPATGQPYLNRFAHVLVPGNWLRRRLVRSEAIDLGRQQVHVVGWPRLDALLERRAAWLARRPDRERPRVLWAPTHDARKRAGRSTSSYPDFEAFLPRLADVADVTVSVHPRNRSQKEPTADALVRADVVVSDFGTMVYEAWALGIPVVFPRWILGDRLIEHLPRSAEAHLYSHEIGVHARTFEELLDVVAEPPQQLGGDVNAFMDDYLDPATRGVSGRRAAAVLQRLRWSSGGR